MSATARSVGALQRGGGPIHIKVIPTCVRPHVIVVQVQAILIRGEAILITVVTSARFITILSPQD